MKRVRVPLADVASIELSPDGSSNGYGSGTSLPSDDDLSMSDYALYRQHYYEERVAWQRLPHSLPVRYEDVVFSSARPGEPDGDATTIDSDEAGSRSSAVEMQHVAVGRSAPAARFTVPGAASSDGDDGAATPGTAAEAPDTTSEPATEIAVTPAARAKRSLTVTLSSLRRGCVRAEPSPEFHYRLLRVRSDASDLRCALLARAIAAFNAQHGLDGNARSNAGGSSDSGDSEEDSGAGSEHGQGDEAAVATATRAEDAADATVHTAQPAPTGRILRPRPSAESRNATSLLFVIDDQPWDAAVMDATAFAVPLSETLTGDIVVMDVLLRALLWLPPDQGTLLAVSGVSRGWRGAAERLPQWCMVPQLRFVNKSVHNYYTGYDDADQRAWAGGANVCTRPAYCITMRGRQEIHRGSRQRLRAARRMERRAASRGSLVLTGLFALITFALALAVGGVLAYGLASVSSDAYGKGGDPGDGGDFAGMPIIFLAVLCLFLFKALRDRIVVHCFTGIKKSTKQRTARWFAILAVLTGTTIHLTVPFGLVINRIVHFDLVLSHVLDVATDTSQLCRPTTAGGGGGGGRNLLVTVSPTPPPAYVKVANIEEWTVVPWFRGFANNASGPVGPFVRDPLDHRGELNRTAIGALAPHNDSLYRTLCDADALAVAEGPKWLARRLSTAEGIRALINDTHQCNDGFAIPDWMFGLMQPVSELRLHRYVLLVPPVAQQAACGGNLPPIAVFVSHERREFLDLMRRIANGGTTTGGGTPTTTFFRTAWRTALFNVDVAFRDAGETWFTEVSRQSRFRFFKLFYNRTDAALGLAIAAMNLSTADAGVLFNRSRGRLQPLYADGSVRPDNRRFGWWLEAPERFEETLLWGPARVPLVAPHAAQDPAEERRQWYTRLYVIGGVGFFLIAGATALALLPSRVVASETLLWGAVALCVVLVNPLWLMAWGVGCEVRPDPQYCLTNESGNIALIATGVTLLLSFGLISCRIAIGDDD